MKKIINACMNLMPDSIKEIGLKGLIILLFNFIFYRLKYIDDKDENEVGYFLVKRRWVWLILTPIILPVFHILPHIIISIHEYYEFIYTYRSHWISTEKRNLTLEQKIDFRIRLWD